jgi:alkylation response protein AidB-like acyl-CoA dehydrogenase
MDSPQLACALWRPQLRIGFLIWLLLRCRLKCLVVFSHYGGIQSLFDMTLEYLKVREHFGAKVGSFQALKHRAARWFCEVELSRAVVLDALRAIDHGTDGVSAIASACKARLADTYDLSGKEGTQMHGGIGVTDEHDVDFL